MILREQNIGYSTLDKQSPPFRLVDLDLAKADLVFAFQTRRGERVMRPNFGSIIHDLLFEPFDDDTKQAVIDDAVKIIREDPRFQLATIDVTDLEHSLRLDISLNYIPLDVVATLAVVFDKQSTEAL